MPHYLWHSVVLSMKQQFKFKASGKEHKSMNLTEFVVAKYQYLSTHTACFAYTNRVLIFVWLCSCPALPLLKDAQVLVSYVSMLHGVTRRCFDLAHYCRTPAFCIQSTNILWQLQNSKFSLSSSRATTKQALPLLSEGTRKFTNISKVKVLKQTS